MVNKLNRFLIVLLFLLGFFARLWQFSQIPTSLYWDEVAIGLDARSLSQTGQDINLRSWLQPLFYSYGDYKAPVYIWLTALLAKFFPVNQLLVRLPSLLASILIAVILYRLIKLLAPKSSNLPVLITLSYWLLPWSIHFSRIAMESHLSLLFLTLSVYLSVLSAKSRRPWLLIPSALAVSFGIYTYISLRIIAPILFILSFIIFHRPQFKPHLAGFLSGLALIFLSIIFLTSSPDYSASQSYRLSNDNLLKSTAHIDKSLSAKGESDQLLARLFHHRYFYQLENYLSNYSAYFSSHFLFLTGDPNLRHHSGFGGQLLLPQAVFFYLGLFWLFSQPKNQRFLILAWLALAPTIAALVNETPHASRSIYLVIPLAYLIGLGLTKLKPQLLSFVLILLGLNLSLYLHDYFVHYPSRSALAWIQPYKQAALYIKNHPTDQPIYVTGQFYQPWLYFQFYAQTPIQELIDTCPLNALCLTDPGWQPDNTQTVASIPGTDALVVKKSYEKEK